MVAMRVHVRGAEELANQLRLTRRQIAIAETQAMNETAKTLISKSSARIRKRYAIPARVLKGVRRKSAEGTRGEIRPGHIRAIPADRYRGYAEIIYKSRGIKLSEFPHEPRMARRDQKRRKAGPMEVQVLKGRWRKYPGAFKIRSEKWAHIYREIPGSRKLEPMWGPSVAAIVDQTMLRYINRFGLVTLRKQLERQFKRRAFAGTSVRRSRFRR